MWQKNRNGSGRGFFGFELPHIIMEPLRIWRAAGEIHSGCWTTLQKYSQRCLERVVASDRWHTAAQAGLGILWRLTFPYDISKHHGFGSGDWRTRGLESWMQGFWLLRSRLKVRKTYGLLGLPFIIYKMGKIISTFWNVCEARPRWIHKTARHGAEDLVSAQFPAFLYLDLSPRVSVGQST